MIVLAFGGCDRGGAGEEIVQGPPPAADVRADRTGLMFRYLDGQGGMTPAASMDEIPAEARAEVVVVDTALAPEARGSARWVQLADLRAPDEEGRFPVQVLPRRAFEARLRTKAVVAGPSVIMYSASWCGVCRKARAFLQGAGVPFVEKDIEKDAGASAELQRKAAKAGVKASGVPVFDIGGVIVPGFDQGKIARLLKGPRP